MPNFIVPVVGNPNGGFQDGDQVTAENLNAHVQDAVPTGEFISGRGESLAVGDLDYFLKLGEDGNLYKVKSTLVGGDILKPIQIRSKTGNGTSSTFGNIAINETSNLNITLNGYLDETEPFGGEFNAKANKYLFRFNSTKDNLLNDFIVGDDPSRKANNFTVGTVSGTIDSETPFRFSGNHAIKIPFGTAAQRPQGGQELWGSVRINTESKDLEFFDGSGWGATKTSGEVTYVKQIPAFTFNWDAVFYETPAVVVPEGEVWIYELNYQFNADNWGGNTRPECVFSTALCFNTVVKVQMNHFTGPYGGPVSSATATVTLRREDTFVNGTAFPVKIVWKNVPGGSRRFGSYSDGAFAYGYIKLTKVKVAAQGSTPLL